MLKCIILFITLFINIAFSHGENKNKLWAWGRNTEGQLGNGRHINTNYPVQVLIDDIKMVSASDIHALALKNDGTIWAWGLNYKGVFGIGTDKGIFNTPLKVPGIENVVQVSTLGLSVALKEDGTVWWWPDEINEIYELIKAEGLSDVIAVSAGSFHLLALKKDGTVWAWGYNMFGQLGNGSHDDCTTCPFYRTPTKVLNLRSVKSILAGPMNSYAIKEDGTVWAWGDNRTYQCGTWAPPYFITTPQKVQNIDSVVQIAAGESGCRALKEDGTVWEWGGSSWKPQQIEGIYDVKKIGTSMVLKKDGTILTWCYGESGPVWGLGNGTLKCTNGEPVQVLYLNNVKEISSGFSNFAIGEGPNYLADIFIPAVARAEGWGGTKWKTDLYILNPLEEENCFNLKYVEGGKDGKDASVCQRICLEGKKGTIISNAVYNLFGIERNTAGNIRIEREKKLIVNSRTYNQKENGTYGQYVPSLTENEAVLKGEEGFIIGIRQDEKFRTNIGFTEVKGIETDVLVSLYKAEGEEIARKEFKLLPYGWLQISLSEIYSGEIDNGYIKVKVEEDGGVISYGSIIDNRTGDAIFISSQEEIPTDVYLLVPVAANISGGCGTNWKTDLWLLNNSSSEKEIKLTYFVGYDYYKKSVFLKAGEQKKMEDVVGSLFPEAGESAGSLYLVNNSWEGKVMGISRTYNDKEDGSYGQFIPVLKSMDLNSVREEVYIVPVLCNENYRTNIGFTAFSEYWMWPKVEVWSLDGYLLGSKEYFVEWYGNLQVDLFKDMGIECNVDGAYLKIYANTDVFSGEMTSKNGGSFYVSVIDNRTGDAIFISSK